MGDDELALSPVGEACPSNTRLGLFGYGVPPLTL